MEYNKHISAEELDRILTDQIVSGLGNTWDTRTGHAIDNFNRAGLVFLFGKDIPIDLTHENIQKDWRLLTMFVRHNGKLSAQGMEILPLQGWKTFHPKLFLIKATQFFPLCFAHAHARP